MQSKSPDPTTTRQQPPRAAAFLLRLFSPAAEHEELLGDLSEEYNEHWLPRGRRAAARWYWSQALRSLRAGLDRPHRRVPGKRKGDGLMRNVLQDVRYGVRSLMNAPMFTGLTILTLTLAIGVNSAIFSMVSAILFSQMPLQETETAVFVWTNSTERGVDRGSSSLPDFLEFRDQIDALEGVVAIGRRSGILSGVEEPTRVQIGLASADMLQVWGLPPHLGRSFAAGEDAPGAARVAMLSHGLFERRFGADPGVIGREVKIDGHPSIIVGVVSPQMEFGDLAANDLWIPMILDAAAARDQRDLFVSARIAPGATLEQAQAEAALLGQRLAERYPETNRGWAIEIQDFQSGLADDTFWTVITLLGITVGFVMLIACSNVATMTLARATSRAQELAVRAAIGAGRGRIMRQLVTESLLVSLVSAALGLLVARGALYGLTWIAGENSGVTTFFQMLSIDTGVLMFTLAVALLAPLVFGLIPAIRASRADLAATLKEGGRTSGDVASLRGRRILVATQVSLAVALMVVAGLMVRALLELRSMEFSHEPEKILTMRVDLPDAGYPEVEQVRQFRREVGDRVETEPGVVRVAWVNTRPVADFRGPASFEIAGAELRSEEQQPFAYRMAVSPAYFDMMKLRPLTGRLFGSSDRSDAARVTLVNAEAVERFWAAADPVGQEIRTGDGEWAEIVGVVANELNPDPSDPVLPRIYVPIEQHTELGGALLVEVLDDPLALAGTVRRAVQATDPEQPVADVRTQARIYADGNSSVNAVAGMLATFALFALVMAGAGIYGVLSFMVAERTREFGIRMALGASRRSVRTMVMRNSGALIGAGVLVGLLGALGLGRLLASALNGVNAIDPLVYSAVGLVLFSVAALAAWIPARRATRVEPVVALRAD